VAEGAEREFEVIVEDAEELVLDVACIGTLAWSPDGERLAYVAHSDGVGVRQDIFITNVDGSGMPLQVTDVGDAEEISWSPDGSSIVFSRWHVPECEAQLWLVDADGADLQPLTASGVQQRSPAWSPDGQSIAYVDGDFIRLIGRRWVERPAGRTGRCDRSGVAPEDIATQCAYAIMTMGPDGIDVQPAGPQIDICEELGPLRPIRHPAWGHDGI
jgi:Tol biopolymer transport system component